MRSYTYTSGSSRVFASLLGEDDVRFLVYVSRGVSQTAAALEDDVAVQVDMPIETALARPTRFGQ